MERKTALITGITGQDGSFLAEFLLDKGYDVHGTIRRSSVDFRERIAHLEGKPNFHLHYADLSDSMSILQVVSKVQPTEIYNLAAQSHVQVSFDSPEFTANVDATGVLRVLEAVRLCGLKDTCRIYQASTSELYGKVEEVPQNENTPFHPYSPYAVAKLYGFWIVKEYREAYNMYCCSGILFNHESERRGETFVTRKITLAAARIAQGKQEKLYLGNLDSLRDWGYAKDYVECMWLILQHETPEDFVIATGVQHSVREFCYLAFKYAGIELEFKGEGINEKGYDKATGKCLVEVSEDFYRPTDVVNLWGDPTKAKAKLGWNPSKTTFEELVKIMVDADMAKVAVEKAGEQIRTNLAEYLEKFELPLGCLQTKEGLSAAAQDLALSAAKEQVKYLEVRFAPAFSMEQGLSVREILESVRDGLKKAEEKADILTGMIVCTMRNLETEKNIAMLKEAREFLGNGVVACDLAGDEKAYPTAAFADVFATAKKYGMPYTIHAGECGSREEIRTAIELGTSRIGHGIAMSGDEELKKEVAEKKIGVELCPTSNLQTKAVTDFTDYPFREFYDAGILLSINTDNRTVSDTSCTDEYMRLAEAGMFQEPMCEKIYMASLHSAFADDDTKQVLWKKWMSMFDL